MDMSWLWGAAMDAHTSFLKRDSWHVDVDEHRAMAACSCRTLTTSTVVRCPDIIWECLLMLSQALPDPVAVQNGYVLFTNRTCKPLFGHNVTATAANDGSSEHVACTASVQQGRVDLVNGDTVISALQQTV
eukprot:157450-Amphidinium_carterae.1